MSLRFLDILHLAQFTLNDPRRGLQDAFAGGTALGRKSCGRACGVHLPNSLPPSHIMRFAIKAARRSAAASPLINQQLTPPSRGAILGSETQNCRPSVLALWRLAERTARHREGAPWPGCFR